MEQQARIPFGAMPDGTVAEMITLRRGACSCRILTYGGAIQSLVVPDRQGNLVDVVLGFDIGSRTSISEPSSAGMATASAGPPSP